MYEQRVYHSRQTLLDGHEHLFACSRYFPQILDRHRRIIFGVIAIFDPVKF